MNGDEHPVRDAVETAACCVVLLVFVGFCATIFWRALQMPAGQDVDNEVIFIGTWMTREIGGLIYARVKEANAGNGNSR